MFFDSFGDLISMGGYGGYVWSAFGVTFISMLVLLVNSIRTGNRILKDVRDKQAREARIEAAKNLENTL